MANTIVDYGNITSQASNIECVLDGEKTNVQNALNMLDEELPKEYEEYDLKNLLPTTGAIVVDTTYTDFKAYKFGKFVWLYCRYLKVPARISTFAQHNLAVLPENLRPAFAINTTMVDVNQIGTATPEAYIGTNGLISTLLRNVSADTYFSFTAVYITNN